MTLTYLDMVSHPKQVEENGPPRLEIFDEREWSLRGGALLNSYQKNNLFLLDGSGKVIWIRKPVSARMIIFQQII